MGSTKKTKAVAKEATGVAETLAALKAEIDKHTEVIQGELAKIRDIHKKVVMLVNSAALEAAEAPAAKKPEPKRAKKPAKEKSAAGLSAQQAPVPEMQAGKDAAHAPSVRKSPHEITLNIGSQPVRELAESDAKDLLNNPKVFWYRPIQFPDPKRYKVQPRVMTAKVVERKDPKFTRAPWTVSVTISATGDDKRCESWLSGVLSKNKSDQE